MDRPSTSSSFNRLMINTTISTDERFFTPRAQASTARSTSSFGTPRSSSCLSNMDPTDPLLSARSALGSSSSESEFVTPRGNYSSTSSSYMQQHHPGYLNANSRGMPYRNQNQMMNFNQDHIHQQQYTSQMQQHHHHHQRPHTAHTFHNSSHNRRVNNHYNHDHGLNNTSSYEAQRSRQEYPSSNTYENIPSSYPKKNSNYSYYDEEEANDEMDRGGAPISTYYQQRNTYTKHNNTYKIIKQKDIDDLISFTRHGRIDDMNLLLSSKNIPIDTVFDENGNNLLSIACQNGNKKVVKFILRQQQQQQAAMNSNDSRMLLVNYMNGSNLNGNTALHFSFKFGFGDTLGEYLISKGADRSIRNKDGLTCDDLNTF